MCGIVGIVTDEKPNSKDSTDRIMFMQQALIIDTLRGDDAAGTYGCKRGKAEIPAFAKGTGTGYGLIGSKQWQELFGKDKVADYKYIVGHNRSATQGGTGVEVAHPFQVGDITLVHNGTLTNTHTMPDSQFQAGTLNDSHTICYNLSKHDALDVLQTINGAFALVWHDARDDSLNLARNNERPLSLAKAAKMDTVYFASEGEMLYLLDARIGLGLSQIVSLNPYYWLKFTPESGIKPKVRQFEKYDASKHRRAAKTVATSQGWSNDSDTDYTPRPQMNYTGVITPLHPKMEANKRKSKPPAKSNISEKLQLDLMNYELVVEQDLDFLPQMGEEIPRVGGMSTYAVTGHIRRTKGETPGLLAIVYGVPEPIYQACCDRVWTVNALGIKKTATDQPIVVCQFRHSLASDQGTEYTNVHTHTIKAGAMPKELVRPRNTAISYRGPEGSWLRFHEWKKAVSDGCTTCGYLFSAADADDITWVDERKKPWCKKCREESFSANPESKEIN